jgi:hypothetical protein
MRSSPRAILGEKCGFVGCEKIENPELETVWKQWKRFGNGFAANCFPQERRKMRFLLKMETVRKRWKRLGNG